MGRRNSRIEGAAASIRRFVLHQICRVRAWRLRRTGRSLLLGWSPDSLTKLLMDADGVTEAELNGLLRKVAAARGGGEKYGDSSTGCTRTSTLTGVPVTTGARPWDLVPRPCSR
jgi:hypothetical protein